MADEPMTNDQTVTEAIKEILDDESLDTAVDTVVSRLISFGIEPAVDDAFAIAFAIKKAHWHILNQIAWTFVPDGLFYTFVDMACGEYMQTALATGKLTLDSVDFEGIVSSVSEGDTSVSFDTSGSAEANLKSLLAYMIAGEGGDLLCYRKLRW